MKKSEVLNLNYACAQKIDEILQHNISSDTERILTKTRHKLETQARKIAFKIGNTKNDMAKLAEYFQRYSNLSQELDNLLLKVEKAEQLRPTVEFEDIPTDGILKAGIATDDKSKKNKEPKKANNPKKASNPKKVIATRSLLIGAACAVCIAGIAVGCNKNKNNKDDNSLSDPSISTNDTNQLKIDGAILNNPVELEKYATNILLSLNNNNLTISDIAKAIKLANWDYLDIQKIMDNQEDLITTMQLSSYIVNTLGSDAIVYKDPYGDIYLSQAELQDILDCVADQKITVADYNNALVNGKYDIYKVMEINLRNVNEDNDKSAYFGKVANDIMSRILLSSSLMTNSPLATRYVLTAMYNDNAQTIIKKTTHFGSSIYGDGVSVDGDYGFTCVESLAEYLAYTDKNGNVNTNNAEIGIYSQLLIDSPTLSR